MWHNNSKKKRVELAFDGEGEQSSPHIPLENEAKAWHEDLVLLRDAVRTINHQQSIPDAQFPVFFEGIRKNAHSTHRKPHWNSIWTLVSLASAALIVATAWFVMLSGDSPQVEATVVEEATTQIEGARVIWYTSGEGEATIWVDMTDEDVW